jgi:hypothetical protein
MMYRRVQKTCYFGIEVKRLRCRPVTAHGAGSTPVSPAYYKIIMKLNYTLIDDFFEDVDDIRKYALSLKYIKSTNDTGWKGFRTQLFDNNILEFIKSKLIEVDENFKNLNIRAYYHYSLDNTKNEVKNFKEYRLHKDPSEWAGVIYLTPNPKENSGTTLHNDNGEIIHNIENKYNRLIFYRGNILHGVLDTFGDNLENSRLTITIFGDTIDKTSKTLI